MVNDFNIRDLNLKFFYCVIKKIADSLTGFV